MPRISLIIPAYNVEKYIVDCINSILSQDFQDFEILLINDGSTDSTGTICETIKLNNSNIRYFSKENEGPSETRNFGIRRATGEYLYFLDSDDLLEKGALKAIDKGLKYWNEPDVLITNYIRFDDVTGDEIKCASIPNSLFSDKNTKNKIPEQYAKCYIYGNMDVMPPLFIVKREYIIKNSLYFKKGIQHEDELWSSQIFLSADRVGFLKTSCYKYRDNRKGSLSEKITKKSLLDGLLAIDELCKIGKNSPASISKMYFSRAACMLNGFMTVDIPDASKKEIIQGVTKRAKVLLKSVQKKYWILYVLIKLFGFDLVSKIEKRFITKQ